MGLVELLLYIIVAVLIGWGAVWVIGYLAPGHPAIIDRLVWVVVIILVVLAVLQAFGLVGMDPRVPRLHG